MRPLAVGTARASDMSPHAQARLIALQRFPLIARAGASSSRLPDNPLGNKLRPLLGTAATGAIGQDRMIASKDRAAAQDSVRTVAPRSQTTALAGS